VAAPALTPCDQALGLAAHIKAEASANDRRERNMGIEWARGETLKLKNWRGGAWVLSSRHAVPKVRAMAGVM
jgi:hypothetical protein